MLAIGDLQRLLGPDRAVTARLDLTLRTGRGRQNLTGVWNSWFINPMDAAPDYAGAKEKRFRQWLVSDSNLEAHRVVAFQATALVSSMILDSTGSREGARITAGRAAVYGGGFARQVSDESAKVRINMARDPAPGPALAEQRSLVAGHRSGIRAISSGGSFWFADLPGDAPPPGLP